MKHTIFENYPKELTLVRHGESEFNGVNITVGLQSEELRKRFANISDCSVPLTPKGENQAICAGKGLFESGVVFDTAYHSGYARTKETLRLVLEEFPENLQPATVEDFSLRERECGYALGMTKSEMKSHFPYWDEYYNRTGPFLARPVGGESIADVCERVRSSLALIFKENKGKRLLFASHGRVISVVRFILEDGWTLEKINQFLNGNGGRNCGVTSYRYNEEKNMMDLLEYDKVFDA